VEQRWLLTLLFTTGFVSMAMEVVWTRAFTPDLKTQVYSFALVVFVYLLATACGSALYRRHLARDSVWPMAWIVALLAGAALLPVVVDDRRLLHVDLTYDLQTRNAIILLTSISPFCLALGYLSPRLIDEFAGGQPQAAGRAYAVNVLGCILGPLAASYLLLPWLNVRWALLLLSLPLVAFWLRVWPALDLRQRVGSSLFSGGLLLVAIAHSRGLEEYVSKKYPEAVVRRDHVASVISVGKGLDRMLLVNGIGMTRLTTVTKCMAHLPLTFHRGRPESALVICFGMGTSFRAALSWDVRTTAVELVPSVPAAFDYYFADAELARSNPLGRIVVDDGRRYLKRTEEKYDVIIVDPPPPVETAGSSLLYSTEFYEAAKARLGRDGILQAWFPAGEELTWQAVARSVHDAFPHVRIFPGIEGWGAHFVASMEPIDPLSVDDWIARLPAKARGDLLEWNADADLKAWLRPMLGWEAKITSLLNPDPRVRITDDQPFNEYFLLRRTGLMFR
jgi:predicted membrane-bound spermidine synthase